MEEFFNYWSVSSFVVTKGGAYSARLTNFHTTIEQGKNLGPDKVTILDKISRRSLTTFEETGITAGFFYFETGI